MRKILIAAAVISMTAVPAFAGKNSNASISVSSGMNGALARPGGQNQVSVPSRPSLPTLPSPPPRPAR